MWIHKSKARDREYELNTRIKELEDLLCPGGKHDYRRISSSQTRVVYECARCKQIRNVRAPKGGPYVP